MVPGHHEMRSSFPFRRFCCAFGLAHLWLLETGPAEAAACRCCKDKRCGVAFHVLAEARMDIQQDHDPAATEALGLDNDCASHVGHLMGHAEIAIDPGNIEKPLPGFGRFNQSRVPGFRSARKLD
jgi:hypothetical protein